MGTNVLYITFSIGSIYQRERATFATLGTDRAIGLIQCIYSERNVCVHILQCTLERATQLHERESRVTTANYANNGCPNVRSY